MKAAGFEFPGHTEYLAHLSNTEDVLMLMVANELRVAVVTGHIPLKDVAEQITKEAVEKKLRLFISTLQKDFAIRKPRIAVLGLNPHAGDRGTLGDEEIEIINPVVKKLFDEGELVYGSYSSDGFFGSANLKNFDGILSMYHDQGLPVLKYASFGKAVNITLGLPFIRTSVDHGTALDIAGTNKASPESLIAAISASLNIVNNRNDTKN